MARPRPDSESVLRHRHRVEIDRRRIGRVGEDGREGVGVGGQLHRHLDGPAGRGVLDDVRGDLADREAEQQPVFLTAGGGVLEEPVESFVRAVDQDGIGDPVESDGRFRRHRTPTRASGSREARDRGW